MVLTLSSRLWVKPLRSRTRSSIYFTLSWVTTKIPCICSFLRWEGWPKCPAFPSLVLLFILLLRSHQYFKAKKNYNGKDYPSYLGVYKVYKACQNIYIISMGSDPPKPKEPEKTLKGISPFIQNKSRSTPQKSARCVESFSVSAWNWRWTIRRWQRTWRRCWTRTLPQYW